MWKHISYMFVEFHLPRFFQDIVCFKTSFNSVSRTAAGHLAAIEFQPYRMQSFLFEHFLCQFSCKNQQYWRQILWILEHYLCLIQHLSLPPADHNYPTSYVASSEMHPSYQPKGQTLEISCFFFAGDTPIMSSSEEYFLMNISL